MNPAINSKEQLFISSVLDHGYLRNNHDIDITDVAHNLFPDQNTPGYSEDDYRSFRTSINQLDQPAHSGKRYVFVNPTDNPRKDAMDALFSEAFKTNSEEIIALAEHCSGRQIYSPWKKAFVIDLPKMSGQFLSHPVVKGALIVATFFIVFSSLYSLYAFSTAFTSSTIMPALSFIATQLPPQALFITTYATGVVNFIRRNPRTCFYSSLSVSLITSAIAQAPNTSPLARRVATVANQIASFVHISCKNLTSRFYSHFTVLIDAVINTHHSISVIDNISGALKKHTEDAEAHRLRICKEKAYAVWMKIVEKEPAPTPLEQQAV